ncbi:MAG: DNA double-strand break repair nuclease NurA [Chloroflexota bacterium]
MPFDAAEVARQIEASRGSVRAEEAVRLDALDLAYRIYHAVGETEWEQRVQDTATRRWVAAPLSPLQSFPAHKSAAPDYRVVATDSSFIAPDKHRGAMSHLVNVGRVMLLYGDQRAAEIDNTPNHYPELAADDEESFSGKVLGAKCALRELQELYSWASQYGADVALVDGSLMQLVNVLSKESQVMQIMSEYLQTLQAFEQIGVPVVGYISQPASGMVMRAIRLLACEQQTPHEQRPEDPCTCSPLWSIDDSDLFAELIADGERSPVFQAVYRDLVGPNAKIAEDVVFAYLGTQYEIARLEFPLWVANKGLLERTIEIILHQCRLGKGYPNALLLAHQYAVLHNTDRESYYFLLERAGLMRKPTEKAQGKRTVGQAI